MAETVDSAPLVVVSPHLDDAVLACGQLLASHPGSVVITAFAGRPRVAAPLTEWDAASGFASGDDVVGLRRQEDRAALANLSARPIWLDFVDDQYGEPADTALLSARLEAAIVQTGLPVVVVPMGLFHHDHKLTHEAAIAVLRRQRSLTWFAYEDAMYRAFTGEIGKRLAHLASVGILAAPADIASADGRERKAAALEQYASQLRALATPGRPGHQDALAPEHFWRLTVRQASMPKRRYDRALIVAESPPHPAPDPRVGVVVLTYNRAAEVVRTTANLLALPERPRVWIVDNGSADGASEAIRRRFSSEQVALVRLETNLGAAGRNVGLRLCDRPYVALCDDDTWWEPGSLRRAADLLDAHPSLAIITGKVLVGPSDQVDPTCLLMAKSPLRAVGLPGAALLGFLAGASMVRRSAVLGVGGFDPRLFLGSEEELVALDLVAGGWHLAYVQDVVVHHHPSRLRDAEGRRRLIARNNLWVAWLRRPWQQAVAMTVATVRASLGRPALRGALRDALVGLPWVVRERRVIPKHVEASLRLLERQRSVR